MGPLSRRRAACLLVAAVVVASGCGGDGEAAGDPEELCARLERLTRSDPFAAFGDSATGEEVEVAFAALIEMADDLVEVATPEARPAARELARSARALDSLLAGAGYDPVALDVRAYRNEQAAYLDAAQRLENHLASRC